ncbi:MAG: VacJ family lipoprotein [Acidiferrobacterales bacterium]|nr:VacJ family lipoprotein [Acidiferrobacterales bacterium]
MNVLRMRKWVATGLLLLSALLLTGCASSGSVDNDPFESYNRKMTSFNLASDRVILAPVARGYKKVVPSPIRNGISNFLSNLREPYNALNDLLQGNFRGAGRDTGRFLINTTLGFAGLNDVATYLDIPEKREDFGQTLAVWGVPSGPHLVLPFFGPSNIRDTGGLVPGFIYNSATAFEDSTVNQGLFVLGVVDTRTQFLGTEKLIDLQPDAYLFLREGYRQRRTAAIANGEIANEEGDDDDLLDELLDEN